MSIQTAENSHYLESEALYAWMKREVKGLYGQCFEFAFDVAKKAEKALQHETGDPTLNFVQFGYLAGKEGLLAGEKLHLDVKRMEMAYHELCRREYELTKHVSVLQLDPVALLQLRAAGSCEISLPEELFDMDCPGHYFRRLKSVALSIPCVTGPYTSVNCTLTLLSNDIRVSDAPSDNGYQRNGSEDSRFRPSFVGVQAIVTSSAQNDSGLFETNLHDERYLPFEGAGAVSRWRLELPKDLRTFDYDTIADAVLHLRYTARDGGVRLRKEATDNLMARIAEARAAGSARLFSVRHEFPNEWASFNAIEVKDPVMTAALKVTLREEHYPLWSKKFAKEIKSIEILAKTGVGLDISAKPDGTNPVSLKANPLLASQIRNADVPDTAFPDGPIGMVNLYFDRNNFDKDIPANEKIEDLWLLLVWGEES